MKRFAATLLVGCVLALQAAAQGAPKVKVLSPPQDATQATVLVGQASAANMGIVFETMR